MIRASALLIAGLLGGLLLYHWLVPSPAEPVRVVEVGEAPSPPPLTPIPDTKQSLPVPRPYASPVAKPKPPPKAPGTETPERRVARLKAALSADPENPKLLYELGLTLAKDMHAPEEGIPHLEKALKTDSNNGTGFYDLVGAYLESGNIERGTAYLEEMIRTGVENKGAAYAALGDLRAAAGDPVGALPDVQKAHENDPHSPSVTALLASTYLQAGDPRAEDTMKLAEQQQLAKIRELTTQNQPVEFAQRDYQEMLRGRADFLSQNRRWAELEQMATAASGPLKNHIDQLLRQAGG